MVMTQGQAAHLNPLDISLLVAHYGSPVYTAAVIVKAAECLLGSNREVDCGC